MYEYDKELDTYLMNERERQKIYEIKTSITGAHIEDIIVTALEGGISYWAVLDNSTAAWNKRPKEIPVSQYATELLLKGDTIELFDVENEERWQLSLVKLLNGVGEYLKEIENINFADIDANAADSIIQYALFGELVYS